MRFDRSTASVKSHERLVNYMRYGRRESSVARRGVLATVSKHFRDAVVSFERVGDRVIEIIIAAKEQICYFFSATLNRLIALIKQGCFDAWLMRIQ